MRFFDTQRRPSSSDAAPPTPSLPTTSPSPPSSLPPPPPPPPSLLLLLLLFLSSSSTLDGGGGRRAPFAEAFGVGGGGGGGRSLSSSTHRPLLGAGLGGGGGGRGRGGSRLFETSSSSSSFSSSSSSDGTATSTGEESELRTEIEDRNTLTVQEERYGILDGDGTDDADEVTGIIAGRAREVVGASGEDYVTVDYEKKGDGEEKKAGRLSLKERMERSIKPRAYPLFLAEKAAQIVEDLIPKSLSPAEDDAPLNYRERIVVLGTGWGAAAFLKDIDTAKFDVTVVSPRNFFLFTPMLAGSAVGTVEYRSIAEPVRQINPNTNYLEATATSIDPQTSTVNCESVVCEGNSCSIEEFTVPYDTLLVTVGAQTNTFGIPGVREHCCFLKSVEDAKKIRTAIINCFERANLPDATEDDKRAALTFAVIGAGPTGIEFASELRDFIETDGPRFYPDLLRYVSIKVIEASPTVLAPFDRSLQEEAIRQLNKPTEIKDKNKKKTKKAGGGGSGSLQLPDNFQLTELLLNAGVMEVKEKSILLSTGEEIQYGIAVWAAGNGPLPITLQLVDSLSGTGGGAGGYDEQAEAQSAARGRIAVDPWMRALGGRGKILALGDCSCVMTGQLPATAQVASQQGEYLAKLLSKGYDFSPPTPIEEIEKKDGGGVSLPPPARDASTSMSPSESIAAFAAQTGGEYAPPFQFLNLGILAYTGGGSALAQLQLTPDEDRGRVKGTGKVGFGLWRSVYLSKQVSWRNRVLVFLDWTKAQIFGRDITRV